MSVDVQETVNSRPADDEQKGFQPPSQLNCLPGCRGPEGLQGGRQGHRSDGHACTRFHVYLERPKIRMRCFNMLGTTGRSRRHRCPHSHAYTLGFPRK